MKKKQQKIVDMANNLTNNEICDLLNCLSDRIDVYFGLFNKCCLGSKAHFACMNGTQIQLNCETAEYDDLKDWDFFQHALEKKPETEKETTQ
jgi:hypothetical protein